MNVEWNILRQDDVNIKKGRHYPAQLKVEKNKSEEEESWDAENQKHGDSLDGKGETSVILDSSLFWNKVWTHL